ncbi:MAG: hypothetical protein KC502_19030 [Myxococcales bacterium]|nr:hypothetical protein [Myxococcales bacterium]
MTKTRIFLALLLADFVALNIWAVETAGLVELFQQAIGSTGGILLTVDLLLALGFVCTWLYKDAKRRDVNPLPWLALTVMSGSIGWLLYLVVRPGKGAPMLAPVTA